MKIKCNIQMINSIKGKIENIKNKMKNNSKTKVPKKNYALLLLMLLLGVATLSNNIRAYNKSNKESFEEYKLEENTQINSDKVQNNTYETAESSIFTTESNEIVDAVETVSNNIEAAYIMPVDGDIIKDFANDTLVYSKTLDMWKTHPGIDIKASIGTKIVSVCDGKVEEIEDNSFYGNTVKITDKQGYTFVYSNLDSDIKVKEGDTIDKGDTIGVVGVSSTGEIADEAHLHFEILKEGEYINPLELLGLK